MLPAQQLNQILHSPEATYWCDQQGNFVGCNDANAAHLGISSRHHFPSLTLFDCTRDKHIAEAILARDQSILTSGQSHLAVDIYTALNGDKITYHHLKQPILDADGSIIGLLGSGIRLVCNDTPLIHASIPNTFAEHLRSFHHAFSFQPPADHWLHCLTRRECEVLIHLMKGHGTRWIAEKLLCSTRTIEHHLEHIRQKLHCHNKHTLLQFIESEQVTVWMIERLLA